MSCSPHMNQKTLAVIAGGIHPASPVGNAPETPALNHAFLRGALLLMLILPSLGLPYLAMLRETPAFWTNAGGYPLWLRDTAACFLPLLAGQFTLLFLALVGICLRPARSVSAWWIELGTIVAAGLVCAGSAAMVISNNVENLLEGRPLHYHPQTRLEPRNPRRVQAAPEISSPAKNSNNSPASDSVHSTLLCYAL